MYHFLYRSVIVDDEDINSVFRKFCRATFRKIMQNPFQAFFYNIIEPLTILGMMHHVLAEIAMALCGYPTAYQSSDMRRSSFVIPG